MLADPRESVKACNRRSILTATPRERTRSRTATMGVEGFPEAVAVAIFGAFTEAGIATSPRSTFGFSIGLLDGGAGLPFRIVGFSGTPIALLARVSAARVGYAGATYRLMARIFIVTPFVMSACDRCSIIGVSRAAEPSSPAPRRRARR